MCSGKIYYDLDRARRDRNVQHVAIVRLEQLYPFPQVQVDKLLKKYKNAQLIWVQEEPVNMGAASFIQLQLGSLLKEIIARGQSASPATGFKKVHDAEQEEIIKEALA